MIILRVISFGNGIACDKDARVNRICKNIWILCEFYLLFYYKLNDSVLIAVNILYDSINDLNSCFN